MNQQNDYQFVMMPQQLASCLDANCHKMLSTLIGLNSILAKEDGWFYRSNRDLQIDVRFSQNLVIATLDTLYQAGIIKIDCVGKGRGHRSNRIHINFESFKVYERYSFNDIRNNPDLWIETVPYKNHYTPSYCKDKGNEIGNTIGKKVTTNTNTTNTLNTKEYNTNNIEKGKKVTTNEDVEDKEKEYLLDFLSNPSKDYSSLLTNLSYFKQRNNEDLSHTKDTIRKKCGYELSINQIVDKLQVLYAEKGYGKSSW